MSSNQSNETTFNIQVALSRAAEAMREGRLKDAEQLYHLTLERLQPQRPEHVEPTAVCLQSLGDLYFQVQDFASATTAFQKLLALGERIFGLDHPELLPTMHKLAECYQRRGMANEAEFLFTRANRIMPQANKPAQYEQPPPPPARSKPPVEAQASPARQLQEQTHVDIDDQIRNRNASAHDDEEQYSSRVPPRNDASRPRRTIPEFQTRSSKHQVQPQATVSSASLLKHATAVILILCITGAAAFIARQLFLQSQRQITEFPPILGNNYQSADGRKKLSFISPSEVRMTVGNASPQPHKYSRVDDGKDAFVQMLTHPMQKRTLWLHEAEQGLQDEDGTVLYKEDAPELMLVSRMRSLSKFAQEYCLKHGSYPPRETFWKDQTQLSYTNPFKKGGDVEMPRLVCFEKKYDTGTVEHGKTMYITDYLARRKIALEPKMMHAGSIMAVGGVAERKNGAYVSEFYIHGCDRNNTLISGTAPNTVFLIKLKDDKNLTDDEPITPSMAGAFSKYSYADRLMIVHAETPINLPLMRYAFAIVFGAAGIFFCICWGVGKVARMGSWVWLLAAALSLALSLASVIYQSM